MKVFLSFIVFLFISLFFVEIKAQQFFSNSRIRSISQYHSTIGTTTGDAILASSVGGDILGWSICNDAVNTSTYLLVGQAVDVSTDGTSLDKGECFTCENCTGTILKAMNVEAQAADNGYSVIQYRK
jgi:hypothetical protein